MRFVKGLFLCWLSFLVAPCVFASGKAAHVVIMVWDGMRPDFVTAEDTPTLFKMAGQGVTFLHHHPVYLSSTEVNATALATGVYPGQSDLIGNGEYRPAIDAAKPIGVETFAAVRKGDEVSDNHYLAFPTVAEILHEHGLPTVIAGSKPVALLHDRAPRADGSLGVTLFAGRTLPESLQAPLLEEFGAFPKVGKNKIALDAWTTSALTGPLWAKGVPPFTLLWMGEPDWSQHQTGPGSPASLRAIKSCDHNLARVIDALREKHLEDSTDIIVVSDHGFSTIFKNTDVAATLNSNGFHAFRNFTNAPAKTGDILVLGNGGAGFCYVIGHDPRIITQAVHCLQAQPSSGVIFTRTPVEGAFSLADAHIDSADAPDIVVTMRWTSATNKYGAPGMIYCETSSLGPGQGMHASLDPFDMHNTCIAAGPDFKSGFRDSIASGNVDIAPTVLWILGVEPAKKMTGRVLSEALTTPGPEVVPGAPAHREAVWHGDRFVWHQYLDWSTVNGVEYLDQGNAGTTATYTANQTRP